MNKYLDFKKLHHNDKPLLLGNVWNVQSALAFENAGYEALGTSSAAIAHSFGWEDGENMPFEDYLFIIKRILSAVKIPVSVDMESGYGETAHDVFFNIKKLALLGVVGINFEDSRIVNGERILSDVEDTASIIQNISKKLSSEGISMFLNIRSDVFILNVPNAKDEAKRRIDRYQKSGADGIFLPCLTDEVAISEIMEQCNIPLNLLAMPGLPDFETLQKLGIERISSGNFLNDYIYKILNEKSMDITKSQNFRPIYNE